MGTSESDESLALLESEPPKVKASYPPYNCSVTWIKKLFELRRTMNITTVDAKFIAAHIVASNHESKVLNALRYLGLIDQKGNATDKMTLLNAEGDALRGNVKIIVESAYAGLLQDVKVDKAKSETVTGYFTDPKHGGLTVAQAKPAVKFFAWLANEGGIQLSQDLSQLVTPAAGISKKREKKSAEPHPGVTITAPQVERESRIPTSRKAEIPVQGPNASIQATVSMTLDKDTPVEIWRMVLRMLGAEYTEKEAVDS